MQHSPVERMKKPKIALTQWNQNKLQTNIDINRLNQQHESPTRKGEFINTITVNNQKIILYFEARKQLSSHAQHLAL